MARTGDVIGEWRLEDQLGRGGMGTVWRCRNVHASRLIAAMKVVPVDMQPELQRAFSREVAALATLRHPSIVRVLTAGTLPAGDAVYVVMEVVDGVTLRDHVRAHGPLQSEQVDTLLRPLAEALEHAHGRHIHHNDIKPANILLPKEGPPMLVDFGISRITSEDTTWATSETMGTPEYMAPELLEGGATQSGRTDIYALGVVFWEALTGQRLFPPEATPMSTTQRIVRVLSFKRQQGPLDPGENWPAGLRSLVADMTAPHPEQRPADMAEVVARLRGAPAPDRMAEETMTSPWEIDVDELRSLSNVPSPGPAAPARPTPPRTPPGKPSTALGDPAPPAEGDRDRWMLGGLALALGGAPLVGLLTAWWLGALG
jgi:serine/threonine protein kinase